MMPYIETFVDEGALETVEKFSNKTAACIVKSESMFTGDPKLFSKIKVSNFCTLTSVKTVQLF